MLRDALHEVVLLPRLLQPEVAAARLERVVRVVLELVPVTRSRQQRLVDEDFYVLRSGDASFLSDRLFLFFR